jgi:hypothetical protein
MDSSPVSILLFLAHKAYTVSLAMLCSTNQVRMLHAQLITKKVEKNLTNVLDYHYSASWEDKEGEHGLQQMPSLPKCTLLTKLLDHARTCKSISKCDEQNICNLEVVLFCLKHKASTTQLSITDCFWESDLHTGINATFYSFIIFVGLVKNL